MRVFGCARKIYFLEIIWSWPGKWAFDHGNGLKLKFSLQTISGSDAQRERERERERESARARGSQITPSTLPAKPRSSFPGPTIARYSSTIERKPRSYAPVRRSHAPVRRSRGSRRSHAPVRRSISRRSILRRSISLLDLASAQSRLRPTDLSLWFWFLLLLCGGVVVVFGWLWLLIAGICCRGSNWSFGGVWCWLWFWNFFNKICLDAEKIAKKMWKFCRKIAFSE